MSLNAAFVNKLWSLIGLCLLMGLNPVGAASKPHRPLPALGDVPALFAKPQTAPRALVVLFSVPFCTYCEQVRKQSLRSLERDPRYTGRVRVFEVNQESVKAEIRWFDGKLWSGQALSVGLGLKFAPTVMVFRAGGGLAGEPILGAGLPDFYNAYLDEQLADALGEKPIQPH